MNNLNYKDMLTTLSELGMGSWYEVPTGADIPAGTTFAEVYCAFEGRVSQVRTFPNSVSGLRAINRSIRGCGYSYWSPTPIEAPIDWVHWVEKAKRSGCAVEVGGVSIRPLLNGEVEPFKVTIDYLNERIRLSS